MLELHFYTADTLARLERSDEAEAEFFEELKYFPQNTRARAGLAMLYQAGDRFDEAEAVLGDMIRITPTPESYALAARLYSMFGNRKQAEALRAESRRTFPPVKTPARVSRD
jgi:predicted Zn-dependent protease